MKDVEPDRNLDQSWGIAPPYGAYRGHYGDYDLAQAGSMGSGELGGWSAVALGGLFVEPPPAEAPDCDAEELQALAHTDNDARAATVPGEGIVSLPRLA